MFAPSLTTDRPHEQLAPDACEQPIEELQLASDVEKAGPSSSGTAGPPSSGIAGPSTSKAASPSTMEAASPSTSEAASSSTFIRKVKFTIQEVSPLPVAAPKHEANRGRKRGKCGLLNSTPDIEELKNQADEKTRKE
ncbi:unnamed protein product [Psylliodes chrysocephalus]|uniref:Uncharacterized protein n=1 Tax=Psylliodes chrysocephalus TaxID=3402493 RepID=A0A9P0CK94_9CUCU|nr:unnamed protein product [Psylliodes chrysocephala]